MTGLTHKQKEAVGLLQIGTFLEYFDLMLYVHMAVLLNELFFPKTDPHTAALLSAFAFCSTFILRPFGALLFGYIGDNIGRKTTVIITTMMMSTSCVIMANLPTYAQIGITATWIVTLCRIIQGLSSMGEIIGAEIYVTEIVKPPAQYPAVSFIILAASIGSTVALGISSLVTTTGLNWRIAFWVGAGIAVVGSMARTKLRETPEFLEAKKRKLKEDEESKNYVISKEAFEFGKNKRNQIKTHMAYIFIQCGWPMTFYFGYLYFNQLLKGSYGYSVEDIILHNFLLSIIVLFSDMTLIFLSYRIEPLKILKIKGVIFFLYVLIFPFLIKFSSSSLHIFFIQAVLLAMPLAAMPADAVFIRYFPVLKRFKTASFIYAFSRAAMHVITSFGVIYLTESFGHWGVWVIMVPVTLAFLWSVQHFEKIDGLNFSLPRIKQSLEKNSRLKRARS